MSKSEYIESQLKLGKTHSQIIEGQPTEFVVGSIRGANLRNVVDILAKGLQDRLDDAPKSPIKTALVVVFNHLTLPDYSINLSLIENVHLLALAMNAGLVTNDECNQFFELATYQRPLYNITREDFQGEWHELPVTNAQIINFRLRNRAPELTNLLFQMKDQYPDGTESDWYHGNSIYGVEVAKVYKINLSYNGYSRKIRWRCEYALDVEVSV